MKKILSVLLAVLLVASLGVTAFAAEEETVVLDDMGMTLTYPAEYSDDHTRSGHVPHGDLLFCHAQGTV